MRLEKIRNEESDAWSLTAKVLMRGILENAPWFPSCCIQVPTKWAKKPMAMLYKTAWGNLEVYIRISDPLSIMKRRQGDKTCFLR